MLEKDKVELVRLTGLHLKETMMMAENANTALRKSTEIDRELLHRDLILKADKVIATRRFHNILTNPCYSRR